MNKKNNSISLPLTPSSASLRCSPFKIYSFKKPFITVADIKFFFGRIILILLSMLLITNYAFAEIIKDEFIESTLANKEFKPIETNTNYNYENTERVIIKLKIANEITTKKNLQEGDILHFTVKQNVKYKNKVILKQDTIVTGRVKAYITRGLNGIPGQIIIDDFQLPDIDSNKLKSTYIMRGIDLTIMVLPIKWALTPIPFVGSLTNLIIGGHAKISYKDTITLYYYPEWNA